MATTSVKKLIDRFEGFNLRTPSHDTSSSSQQVNKVGLERIAYLEKSLSVSMGKKVLVVLTKDNTIQYQTKIDMYRLLRSVPYFRTIFSFKQSKTKMYQIQLEDVNQLSFKLIQEFLEKGTIRAVETQKMTVESLIDLLSLTDMLQIIPLADYLGHQKLPITDEGLMNVLYAARTLQSDSLMNQCVHYMNRVCKGEFISIDKQKTLQISYRRKTEKLDVLLKYLEVICSVIDFSHVTVECSSVKLRKKDRRALIKITNKLKPVLTGITFSGCEHMSQRSFLKMLKGGTSITNLCINNSFDLKGSGLDKIGKECPNLIRLDLCGQNLLKSHQFKSLLSTTPKLQDLSLLCCWSMDDSVVAVITEYCPDIRKLHFALCDAITDKGLETLSKESCHLEKLDLFACNNITDGGVQSLVNGAPSLAYASFLLCDHVTQDSVLKLGSEKETVKRVHWCESTDEIEVIHY